MRGPKGSFLGANEDIGGELTTSKFQERKKRREESWNSSGKNAKKE